MKLTEESQKYLKSLNEEVASKFKSEIHRRYMHGEDLEDNITYITEFEEQTKTKVPYQFKKELLDGFYGGMQIATDWGEDQSGSLIGKIITQENENPDSIEKIFENNNALKKYIDTVQRACRHISKNEYY